MPNDTILKPYSGEIFATMKYADGRVETKHFENVITNYCALLLAEFLKSNTASVKGISYLAVGTGVGIGTQQSPTPATASLTKLGEEVFRKTVTITYNTEVATITDAGETPPPSVPRYNVLDVACSLGASDASGKAITEMALFAGDATGDADSGTMANMKRFPVWNKPAGAELELIWRIRIQ